MSRLRRGALELSFIIFIFHACRALTSTRAKKSSNHFSFARFSLVRTCEQILFRNAPIHINFILDTERICGF